MKQEQVFSYDYHEIEKIIEQYYKIKEFSIPEVQETPNDIALTYNINDKPLTSGALGDWDKQVIARLRDGEATMYSLQTILNDLCRAEVLPAGKYLIKISW